MEAGLPFVCRQTARPERKPTIGRLPFGPVALFVGVLGVGVSSLHPAHAQPGAQEEASVPRHQSSPQANALERSADAPRAVDRIFDDPLGGVVVNRTVTVLGKDFYQYFSTRWRQSPDANRYTISVHERPTARFGSEIWVQYRQQRVFHTFLPPARAATRPISEFAVQQVLENVSRWELERLTTKHPDLGPEEL